MSKLIISPNETVPGELIIPGQEPVRPLIKPSRRGFMGVLAAAFTGTVVAPMIVSYASMMHIDSPTNRLVFAFRYSDDYLQHSRSYNLTEGEYIKSILNLGECLDPFVRAQWEGQNPELSYDLVREGTIPDRYEHCYGSINLSDWDGGRDVQRLKEVAGAVQRRVAAFKERGYGEI